MPEVRGNFKSFPAAVDYFRRKVNIPTARWDDLQQTDHANGFMVAGVTKAAVLDDIRQAVDAAIADGETLEDFRARFRDTIRRFGWPGGKGGDDETGFNWRTSVIYHTNLRTAYMAGRWESLKAFPYLKYQHNTVTNPRHDHLAWDGKVVATNDPWWETHYPPNGWGCRCSVTGISAARMKVMGKTGPDAPPAPSNGDPAPEWSYNVGESARSMGGAEGLGRKIMDLPADWRKAVLDDAAARNVSWFQPDWDTVLDAALQVRSSGRASPAGWVADDVLQELAKPVERRTTTHAGITPQSALIAVTDRQISHALRDAADADRSLLADGLRTLPSWVSNPPAAWRQLSPSNLAVGYELEDGRFFVAYVRMESFPSRTPEKVLANWLVTAEIRTAEQLRDYARLK
jgi:Uncharacterized protein, homolog of phage Mu protein gp30